MAIQTVTQLDGARRQGRAERQDDARSRAWERVSRGGSVTPSMVAELMGLGLGTEVAQLRGYVEDERRRAAGEAGGVSDDVSLLNYANARERIADGRIRNAAQLASFASRNPLSDNDFRSLTNLVTDPDRETRGQVDRDTTFSEMEQEIKAMELFHDSNGNLIDPSGYNRMRSSALRVFDGMHARGEPPDEQQRRRLVLGLGREQVLAGGQRMRGYQIEEAFRAIPRSEALRIQRLLTRNGRRPTQAQVVDYYNRTQ